MLLPHTFSTPSRCCVPRRCPVPVDSLSRVLARILTERESPAPQKASANRLGELLILCYTDIFQAVGEVVREPEDFR